MNRRFNYYLRELFGLILLSFKVFIPFNQVKILSIYFHDPSPRLFEIIIKYLVSKGYKFISLDQFDALIDKKDLKEKIAVITLDDGWQNNINLLGIIRKYKVHVALFITTSAIEDGNFWFEYVRFGEIPNKSLLTREVIRIKKLNSDEYYTEIEALKARIKTTRSALTKEQLVQMSKEEFVTIASHTVSHISLPDKLIETQLRELVDSKEILENWTGKQIHYLSYPSGDFTDEQKEIAIECGYKLAFTTKTSHIDLNNIDRYSIPRRCVNEDAGIFEALSKIYGIWYKIKK
jgi:peptidoglycan/xylan/chitin deacetylase (PgdA/CDA1 family)